MTLSKVSSDRSVKRGPGRPVALEGDAVAEAVLAIGFRELTFAGVSERLGVAQSTLYRYAANRDELVRAGLDVALRRTEWPDLEGPWTSVLERWSLASWRVWERHPGAVLEAARGVMPSSAVELSAGVAAALVRCGFTAENAVRAVDLVFDLAADSRRSVEAIDAALESEPLPVRQTMERDWAPRHDVEDVVVAQVRGEMVRAIRQEPAEWFHSKLLVVLAGIEQKLAPASMHHETR